jgi:hypothetical protein
MYVAAGDKSTNRLSRSPTMPASLVTWYLNLRQGIHTSAPQLGHARTTKAVKNNITGFCVMQI